MVLLPNLIPGCTLTPSWCVQDNQITRLRFMTTFVVWRKELKQEEKKRRNSANFQSFISQKHLVEIWNVRWCRWPAFPPQKIIWCHGATYTWKSIWNVRWWRWPAFPPQKLFGVMELRMHENHIIILPVNSQVWSTGFLGHTTHYHVSWLRSYICMKISLLFFL